MWLTRPLAMKNASSPSLVFAWSSPRISESRNLGGKSKPTLSYNLYAALDCSLEPHSTEKAATSKVMQSNCKVSLRRCIESTSDCIGMVAWGYVEEIWRTTYLTSGSQLQGWRYRIAVINDEGKTERIVLHLQHRSKACPLHFLANACVDKLICERSMGTIPFLSLNMFHPIMKVGL